MEQHENFGHLKGGGNSQEHPAGYRHGETRTIKHDETESVVAKQVQNRRDKEDDACFSADFVFALEILMQDEAGIEKSTRKMNEDLRRMHPDARTPFTHIGRHCLGPGALVDGMMGRCYHRT
ncbi:hypothetical protein TPAR_08048 [Tolypocladium paradoxum]|uniref:Uncharacterized protein n=1 Tax=Tolypocladium paradoxum TaxID=94208 RepID=A0A2S4KNF5_9HYPO|nr:hypothetical protein TPAR_08048 [Tolypocladium paradoxum]